MAPPSYFGPHVLWEHFFESQYGVFHGFFLAARNQPPGSSWAKNRIWAIPSFQG